MEIESQRDIDDLYLQSLQQKAFQYYYISTKLYYPYYDKLLINAKPRLDSLPFSNRKKYPNYHFHSHHIDKEKAVELSREYSVDYHKLIGIHPSLNFEQDVIEKLESESFKMKNQLKNDETKSFPIDTDEFERVFKYIIENDRIEYLALIGSIAISLVKRDVNNIKYFYECKNIYQIYAMFTILRIHIHDSIIDTNIMSVGINNCLNYVINEDRDEYQCHCYEFILCCIFCYDFQLSYDQRCYLVELFLINCKANKHNEALGMQACIMRILSNHNDVREVIINRLNINDMYQAIRCNYLTIVLFNKLKIQSNDMKVSELFDKESVYERIFISHHLNCIENKSFDHLPNDLMKKMNNLLFPHTKASDECISFAWVIEKTIKYLSENNRIDNPIYLIRDLRQFVLPDNNMFLNYQFKVEKITNSPFIRKKMFKSIIHILKSDKRLADIAYDFQWSINNIPEMYLYSNLSFSINKEVLMISNNVNIVNELFRTKPNDVYTRNLLISLLRPDFSEKVSTFPIQQLKIEENMKECSNLSFIDEENESTIDITKDTLFIKCSNNNKMKQYELEIHKENKWYELNSVLFKYKKNNSTDTDYLIYKKNDEYYLYDQRSKLIQEECVYKLLQQTFVGHEAFEIKYLMYQSKDCKEQIFNFSNINFQQTNIDHVNSFLSLMQFIFTDYSFISFYSFISSYYHGVSINLKSSINTNKEKAIVISQSLENQMVKCKKFNQHNSSRRLLEEYFNLIKNDRELVFCICKNLYLNEMNKHITCFLHEKNRSILLTHLLELILQQHDKESLQLLESVVEEIKMTFDVYYSNITTIKDKQRWNRILFKSLNNIISVFSIVDEYYYDCLVHFIPICFEVIHKSCERKLIEVKLCNSNGKEYTRDNLINTTCLFQFIDKVYNLSDVTLTNVGMKQNEINKFKANKDLIDHIINNLCVLMKWSYSYELIEHIIGIIVYNDEQRSLEVINHITTVMNIIIYEPFIRLLLFLLNIKDEFSRKRCERVIVFFSGHTYRSLSHSILIDIFELLYERYPQYRSYVDYARTFNNIKKFMSSQLSQYYSNTQIMKMNYNELLELSHQKYYKDNDYLKRYMKVVKMIEGFDDREKNILYQKEYQMNKMASLMNNALHIHTMLCQEKEKMGLTKLETVKKVSPKDITSIHDSETVEDYDDDTDDSTITCNN